MTRAVIDLDARATILDAAERISGATDGDAVALVVAAGAPFARNAVFLDVARQLAGPRRLSIVSSDARARSLAASVHIPAYASLRSLERDELDATEELSASRGAALAVIRRSGRPGSARRTLAIAASLLLAAALLLAVALPSAAVTIVAAASPMPSATITLRAGPGGDIAAQPLSATIATKLTGTATGSRTADTKATGAVEFTNQTTDDIRLAKGTVVQTSDGVRFQTTEDKTLPRSVIIVFTLVPGKVTANVEALVGGPSGNVAANRIGVSNSRLYAVSNPQPTSGGDSKTIPVVRAEDYSAATAKAKVDDALAAAARDQQTKWRAQLGADAVVYVGTPSLSSQGPLADVVDKEVATFDVPVTATVQGFAVPADQPGKAALERYRTMAGPGKVLDDASARFTATVAVAADGVTWRIDASGDQKATLEPGLVRGMVAGRSIDDARATLEARGLHVVDLHLSPSWWPRLPVLGARIAVN